MKTIAIFLLMFTAIVRAEQFQASFTDTVWKVTASKLECTLSQKIPGFGQAQFTQSSGQDFSLIFDTISHPAKAGWVNFEIAEAPWQNIEERMPLIHFETQKNQSQFIMSGDLAKQAFTHTEEGKFPTVRYDSYNAFEQVSALLSTVHFRDSSVEFSQCISNLFPYTFEQMRKLTIHFNSESSELNDDAKIALNRLANYVRADGKIKLIKVSGHTDNYGRKRLNIDLSKARSKAIKDYLVNTQKLDEKIITTSYHREYVAAATNKNAKGRAQNRRAEIELIR